jgi:hypothetical protein
VAFFHSPLCVIKKLFIHEQSNTSVYEVYSVLTTSNIDREKYVPAIFATRTWHENARWSIAVEGKLLCAIKKCIHYWNAGKWTWLGTIIDYRLRNGTIYISDTFSLWSLQSMKALSRLSGAVVFFFQHRMKCSRTKWKQNFPECRNETNISTVQ